MSQRFELLWIKCVCMHVNDFAFNKTVTEDMIISVILHGMTITNLGIQ